MDVKFWVSCHKQREFATHILNWLPNISFTNLFQLTWVSPYPELDSWVPASTHDYWGIFMHEAIYIFDRLRMFSDIYHLISMKVPLFNFVVCTCYHKCRLIRTPTDPKNWSLCIVLNHYFSLNLLTLTNLCLIDDQVSVPECDRQDGSEWTVSLVQRGKLETWYWLCCLRQLNFCIIAVEV